MAKKKLEKQRIQVGKDKKTINNEIILFEMMEVIVKINDQAPERIHIHLY